VVQGKFAQYLFAARSKADVNLATILSAAVALNEVLFLETAYQLNRAVVLNLQALGEIGDTGAIAAGCTAQGQHQLMVLGLDAPAPSCQLAEMKEPPDLVTKLAQRRVVRLFKVDRTHVRTLYRIAI
jgi:hypothetical protein